MSDFAALDARLAELNKNFIDMKVEVAQLATRLDTALNGPIEAQRLRWGAREIRYLFFSIALPIIISAMATYYGLKYQVVEISSVLTNHIQIEHSDDK
jgi:hypothetical protein